MNLALIFGCWLAVAALLAWSVATPDRRGTGSR